MVLQFILNGEIMNEKIIQFCTVLLVLFILQSCTAFRTHIDKACANQFADKYSDPQNSRFILPWKTGESYQLTQGNCTLESHNLKAQQHMAFDFKMPIGTAIHASDDGRVAVVIENFRDNIDDKYHQANLIGLEHESGILTWYAHLMLNGAVVEVDDKVKKGQLIGYSGNTGDSAYPHLHFYAQQLTKECHDAENRTAKLELCPLIPVSFQNAQPNDRILKEWQRYTAHPEDE